MQRPRYIIIYYILAPMILISAFFLGYLSYNAAQKIASLGDRTIIDSTVVLAEDKITRLEQKIIDADNLLFHLVDLENLRGFQKQWRDIVRLSPTISSVMVLNQKKKVIKFVSKEGLKEKKNFLKLFQNKVIPDLKLDELPLNFHKHLHKKYNGKYYLFSYTAKTWKNKRFYICLKNNMNYIINGIFEELSKDIEAKWVLRIIDREQTVIFGSLLPINGKFVVERFFPTTLYEWKLQLFPEKIAFINKHSEAKRRSDNLLIGLALSVIILGLGIFIMGTAKERKLNRLKSDFISNVSHELKTPLSLIRMFGELLLLGRVKSREKEREYHKIICQESERLTRLIDNILDLAKIERGRTAYNMKAANLGELVQRSLDIYRPRFTQEKIKLVSYIQTPLPLVKADENALILAFLNLLDNALKYGTGSEEVIVSLKQENSILKFQIQDQGPGIKKEETKKIFDRFYRGNNKMLKEKQGSGIGLALVKHIIEAHHGKVWAESTPGKGSKFFVTIPILK